VGGVGLFLSLLNFEEMDMSTQIQDAYIVAATRLPVGKRNGAYITTRPDDMLAAALNGALGRCQGWTQPASRTSSPAAPCRRPNRA